MARTKQTPRRGGGAVRPPTRQATPINPYTLNHDSTIVSADGYRAVMRIVNENSAVVADRARNARRRRRRIMNDRRMAVVPFEMLGHRALNEDGTGPNEAGYMELVRQHNAGRLVEIDRDEAMPGFGQIPFVRRRPELDRSERRLPTAFQRNYPPTPNSRE